MIHYLCSSRVIYFNILRFVRFVSPHDTFYLQCLSWMSYFNAIAILYCSCHVWLNNVAYCMDSEDYMDIRDHHGKEVAQLHVSIAPCDKKGR